MTPRTYPRRNAIRREHERERARRAERRRVSVARRYYRLALEHQQRILSGELPAGTPLPAEITRTGQFRMAAQYYSLVQQFA